MIQASPGNQLIDGHFGKICDQGDWLQAPFWEDTVQLVRVDHPGQHDVLICMTQSDSNCGSLC